MPRRSNAAALLLACAPLVTLTTLATLATRAQAGAGDERAAPAAATRVHVVLVDGGELQGELVERIPGDHLTLQLATGEIRRIEWAAIASSRDLAGPSEDAPRATIAPRPPSDVVRGWPRPDRRPPPFSGERFVYGVGAGIGAPTGYVGAVVGYEPAPWCEIELGAGLGGKFGYAAAATGRLQAVLVGWMRFGVGLGLSANYTPSPDLAGAPKQTQFLNLEFSQDFALGRSAFLRLTSGVAFLLNPGGFAGLCPKDAGSPSGACASVPPYPAGARAAAVAVDRGRTVALPYFGLELLWMAS